MGTSYAQLLEAYLTLVNYHIKDGCPNKWLAYLRAPIACFNRDLDITKLTFDYDADMAFIYQYYPKKSRTDISLQERLMASNETAYVYFCRTLNAVAISLETSIARASRPGEISFIRNEKGLLINYNWATVTGKRRNISKNISPQFRQLRMCVIKQPEDYDVYHWLWKSNEAESAKSFPEVA